MLKKIFTILVLICFFCFSLYLIHLYHVVNQDISYRIKKGLFEKAVASESPVYYDDGKSLIGVFFKKTHREYLTYNEIPKVFIKALIATEDQRFFEHHGFDIKAILRAFITNIKAGKVVQGGSTITQQLAKNIFGRRKRSYGAKLRELLQAILLERRFSKEKILEMYCNQFFVTGYGKGLQIAARYFFDKDAKDLNLVEAAFIAGAIHGPNRYNPFIKKTKLAKERAIKLAKLRKNYVLKRMLEMHFITKAQYVKAKKQDVPFKKGRITYALNVIMDYIREQLDSNYMRSILKEQGIENIATSGIKIYTSINKDIQQAALMSLRKKLPILDVELNGYSSENEVDIDKIKRSFIGPFPIIAKVISIDKKHIIIHINWDKNKGIVDYSGLKEIGNAWVKWKIGRRAVFSKEYASMFLENIHVGDKIAVWPSNRKNRFILTKIPKLEGAIVVLHNGMIKAMVGGYYNVFYNRAVYAKRQLGSIFKPFLFISALKLRWNILDELYDIKNIYKFEGTYYIPNPDHPPPSDKVSMAWAGIKSENLASVWLLYHLMDKLTMAQFHKVAQLLGLARRKWETYSEYEERMRDRYGILINNNSLLEAAFTIAKKEVEPDIIFSGHEEVLNILPRLQYEIKEEVLDKILGIEEKDHNNDEKEKIELEEKKKEKEEFMKFSYKRLQQLNERMKEEFIEIMDVLKEYNWDKNAVDLQKLSQLLSNFYLFNHRIIYSPEKEDFFYPISPEWLINNMNFFKQKEIWIDNIITSGILDIMQNYLDKEYKRLSSYRPYDSDLLYYIPDFRTLVSLHYVVYMAKKLGISTNLDPVLSFPLGPNSISIIEAALAYQTLITANLYKLGDENSSQMLPIITKILDRNGRLIWRYKSAGKKVLSKRISASISEVLRNVVCLGTGRKAKNAVKIRIGQGTEKVEVPVPCFGKTGTANRFTNSSFVGIVPGVDKKRKKLDLRKGYVIATYVGYDNNIPMKSEHVSIYGASGALPLWISTANAIVNNKSYKDDLQLADLIFTSPKDLILQNEDEFIYIPISPLTGLPSLGHTRFPKILVNAKKKDDKIIFIRYFEP